MSLPSIAVLESIKRNPRYVYLEYRHNETGQHKYVRYTLPHGVTPNTPQANECILAYRGRMTAASKAWEFDGLVPARIAETDANIEIMAFK